MEDVTQGIAEAAVDAEAFNAFEVGGWERVARPYRDFFSAITARTVEPLLDAARVSTGTRLLDVATGPGDAAGRAAQRGARAVGIDVAGPMVELAQATYPDGEYRVADAERLPFEDATFDAAVGNFAIMHLGRPERAVIECARVLAPGGRAAFTVWDAPERCPLFGLLLDAVEEAGAGAPSRIPPGPPFFRYSCQDAFAALLDGAGFTGIEVSTLGFEHTLSSRGELWAGLTSATVRTAPLVLLQPSHIQRSIRTIFERKARRYEHPGGLRVPVSVKLAHGVRATTTGGGSWLSR